MGEGAEVDCVEEGRLEGRFGGGGGSFVCFWVGGLATLQREAGYCAAA